MLKELQVRDLALVASARVRFGPGLNLLTGETGSGKSLIVDALGLTLGARASSDQVRHGSQRAFVEALFEQEAGDLVLAREVGRRSAARIDGRLATPAQLREVGSRLVALHGQHEYQTLTEPEAQTQLLDAYGGCLGARAVVEATHGAWIEAARRLGELIQVRDRGRREEEFLRWQLVELDRAQLRAGELAELEAERSLVRHSARLAELAGQALEALRSDEGLAGAAVGIRTAAGLDPRLDSLAARLELLEEELAEAAAELRSYGEGLEADPGRLEALEARLSVLEGIARKYGGSVEEAILERDRLAAQLGGAEDLTLAISDAEAGLEGVRAALENAAGELTAGRRKAAARMGKEVAGELHGLKLEGARFEVALAARAELGSAGAEQADMMFSANPGEPLAQLARVASGGELARVMLAIKTVGAEADRMPTLIFDEVDAGIGGEAAVQVGLRLKALGSTHQVLVVTHLAQIACFADHHLRVEKAPGPQGRNLVTVRELEGDDERAAELARMMSGGVTEKALARARELLEAARD